MLPYGTADIITAAIFIVYGVRAKRVEHFGEIVTYGVNDMVLDTWGTVENWIAHAPVISYGPSGIGFVNFGTVENFVAEREVVTHGLGARGFNQYDGTVRRIRFDSIETFGDARSVFKSASRSAPSSSTKASRRTARSATHW